MKYLKMVKVILNFANSLSLSKKGTNLKTKRTKIKTKTTSHKVTNQM